MNRIPTRRVALLFGALLLVVLWVLAGQLPRVAPATPSAASQAEVPNPPAAAAVTVIATVEPIDVPVTPEPTTEATIDPYVLTLTAYPTFPSPPAPEVLTQEASAQVAPETLTPTPTAARVINLAEGLVDGEIYVVIVRRANGEYEKYLLDRGPLETAIPQGEFFNLRDEQVGMGVNDSVVNAYLLATPPPKIEPNLEFSATSVQDSENP
jgi:hypothetical protein